MPAIDRSASRAAAQAARIRLDLGYEVRHARLRMGISQERLADRLGWSASKISRIEAARLAAVSIDDAARLAAAVGLRLSVRAYPDGDPIRDAAQSRRLMAFLKNVGPPLRWRTDVVLPQQPDRPRELRAWDAVLDGLGERTGLEYESRLSDMQELVRRHNLKRRDDPVEHFLLVAADTPHNRRVLAEYAELLTGLPRLRTATVLRMLKAGRHPPTGFVLF